MKKTAILKTLIDLNLHNQTIFNVGELKEIAKKSNCTLHDVMYYLRFRKLEQDRQDENTANHFKMVQCAEMLSDIIASYPLWDTIDYYEKYNLTDYNENTDKTTVNRERSINHFLDDLKNNRDDIIEFLQQEYEDMDAINQKRADAILHNLGIK